MPPINQTTYRVSTQACVDVIATLPRLEALRGPWATLWQKCLEATPFQSPAWILPWARHYAADRCGAVIAGSKESLAAIVPFFTWRGSLLLAGTGPSDYGDGLFASEAREHAETILATVCEVAIKRDCKEIDLQQLGAQSPLLNAPAPEHWISECHHGAVCPVAPLCGEDGLGALSSRWRKNLRRARRQLEKHAACDLALISVREAGDTARVLERLHARRWEEKGERGVLADELMRGFLRSALPELSASGLLRAHRLAAQGNSIAVVLALQDRNRAYYYLSGFDPAWAEWSPGLVTVAAAMTHAAREGACEFHFLRGREAYKYHLGAQDRATWRRVLKRAPR